MQRSASQTLQLVAFFCSDLLVQAGQAAGQVDASSGLIVSLPALLSRVSRLIASRCVGRAGSHRRAASR